ncbi:MAG: spore germination protein [Firmicutes bacterium]|nr:spore germination protein [Bacillota bacterium]
MREFVCGEPNTLRCFMAYTDNMVIKEVVEDSLLSSLMHFAKQYPGNKTLTDYLNTTIAVGEIQKLNTVEEACDAVLIGDTVLFAEGADFGLSLSTKAWPTRGVPTAETEVTVMGPKDAFNESASITTVLIRRRIRDTRLKMKRYSIGCFGKTSINLMYMSNLIRPKVLKEIKARLNEIDVKSVPDSGFLEQFMENNVHSPFPQLQLTERPDKAAAAILEGRAVLIVDNTPFVIMAPSTLNTFFQAAEDYYERSGITSFIRVLRYIAAFMAVGVPGLYVALTAFHPLMIPTALALKIAQSRLNIPFPALLEILIMEVAFELLREAGIRLPAPVSPTIGIVGGIVIGQTAVEAGIVGPVVVIVSALAAISTFAIPNSGMVSGLRICKFLVIFACGFFGLFGFWLSMIFILLHLCALKSFGIPYMYPFCSASVTGYADLKDSFFRAPLWSIKKRNIFARPDSKEK